MISYEEALDLLQDQEAIPLGTATLQRGGNAPDTDVRSLDLILSESVKVTMLPNAVYIIEASGDRSRQAKKLLDEFLASLVEPQNGRINESGGRWRLATGDYWAGGVWKWSDFEDGMSFRVEDGRIVYSEGRALPDYVQWYSQKRGT